MLLADSVQRAYWSADTVGSSMLVVDTINERAAAFYEGNGFVRLPDSLRLVLPMHTIRRLVEHDRYLTDPNSNCQTQFKREIVPLEAFTGCVSMNLARRVNRAAVRCWSSTWSAAD